MEVKRKKLKIKNCPRCKTEILESLKGEDWAWCDSCCAEITLIPKKTKKNEKA